MPLAYVRENNDRSNTYKMDPMGRKFLVILCLVFLLAACKSQKPPAGVVATVNGEPIYLHSLETLLDRRTATQSGVQPSLEDMQKNYGNALAVLVSHALVRQELEQQGIEVPEKERDAALEDLRSGLGETDLDAFLAESSIRRDDWEQLMRDYLALETFRNQILEPGIKTGLDEIRDYYQRHETDFNLPAHIRACFLNAQDKASLEALCKGFANMPENGTPLVQCMDMEPAALPSPWLEEQKNMELNHCGKFREEGGNWQSVVILSRSKGRKAKLAEVYALIENRLLEQKIDDAFDKWLENRIATSSIKVLPELNAALASDRKTP